MKNVFVTMGIVDFFYLLSGRGIFSYQTIINLIIVKYVAQNSGSKCRIVGIVGNW